MMKKSRDLIIECVEKFLNSDSSNTMNSCYSAIRDNNSNRRVENLIPKVKDAEFDKMFPLVTNVILTANKFECDSLNYIALQHENSYLQKREHSIPIFMGTNMYAPDAYIFKLHSSFILHLNSHETGSNTPGGSADMVRFISGHPLLDPSYIISFGICYGRDCTTQDFGNVIIPKKLYPWSVGQKINGQKLTIKSDDLNLSLEGIFADNNIYSILRSFCNGEEGITIEDSYTLDDGIPVSFHFKVSMGNMSTGEAVISSDTVKNQIRMATGNESELGGEMEGYGIAKECIYYSKIPCFIMKAICDWGEVKDIDSVLKERNIKYPNNLKDRLQTYAAFCAGLALIRLFDKEKEQLFPLRLMKWLGDKKRKNRINDITYCSRDLVCTNIKKYYCVNDVEAENIFDLLIENNYIYKSPYKDIYLASTIPQK